MEKFVLHTTPPRPTLSSLFSNMKPRKLAAAGSGTTKTADTPAPAAKTPASKAKKTSAASEKKPTKASTKSAAAAAAVSVSEPPKSTKTEKRPTTSSDVATTTPKIKVGVEHIPRERVTRAAEALLQHIHAHRAEQASKKKSSTLPMGEDEDEDGNVVAEDELYIQFCLKLAPEAMMRTFKGRPIRLPHPWRQPTDTVCLFVKDKTEAKKWLGGDDYKLSSGLAKILSLEQLRKQYGQFSQRRALANQFDVFVADDRVVCMLPKALGKPFFSGPKRPLPMRLARHDKLVSTFDNKLKNVLESTFFYQAGTTNSVKIGTANMKAEQLVENALAVIEGAAAVVAGGFKGLQSIHLKAARSAALPLHLDATRLDEKYTTKVAEEKESKSNKKKDASTTKKPVDAASKTTETKTVEKKTTRAPPSKKEEEETKPAKRTKVVVEKKKSR